MAKQLKKFLDANGVAYLASKLNDYPNNEILAAVINGIDEAKQDTSSLEATVKAFINKSYIESLIDNAEEVGF